MGLNSQTWFCSDNTKCTSAYSSFDKLAGSCSLLGLLLSQDNLYIFKLVATVFTYIYFYNDLSAIIFQFGRLNFKKCFPPHQKTVKIFNINNDMK